ncbi:helix-turn-helix domain-containing protein [Providencia rettgeri]
MTGSFAFVSCENSGAVLDMVMETCGFTSKLMMAKYFSMDSSSLSGRYKRNVFSADMVVRCMHETGANLKLLA